MLTLEELLKLASNNKATTAQKKELSKLLSEQVEQEKEDAFDENINKIKNLITELGLNIPEVVKALSNPQVLIFKWKEYKKYSGERGRLPSWVAELKAELKKEEEALKFAKNDAGKAFVKKVFEK
jgi:DNA-binding protein H-NS